MPENEPTRDIWRKIEIIGKGILVPLVVAWIGWLIKDRVASLEEHSQTATRDFTIMNEFRTIYTDPSPKARRLAHHYVNLIQQAQTRNELRRYMVWDILETNLSPASRHAAEDSSVPKDGKTHSEGLKADHHFVFDQEFEAWHMLGEALLDMKKDPSTENFETWWRNDIQKTLSNRWPGEEKELRKLFDWIAQTYWGA